MVDAVEYKHCRKAECEVARTGVCAEGHDPLESCPFYGKEPEIDDLDDPFEEDAIEISESESYQAVHEADLIELPSGEALTVVEVDEFLRWRSIRLITIVGDQDSGKTTLISSIYERFLKGTFADHCFAGSRTLIGLDRRHYYSRVDSGLTIPDTPRTSLLDGVLFYHFAVVQSNEKEVRTDLMLSDRAGEKYRQARDKSDEVAELFEVTKADKLVLLLDGARLAIPTELANAFASVRHTLRAFIDGGILDKSGRVQIVTTKLDRIEIQSKLEKAKIKKQLDEFKQQLSKGFKDRVAELTFFEIAARDPDGTFPPAHGVDQLLRSWIIQTSRVPEIVGTNHLPLKSEFDLLLVRTPMEMIP